MRILFYLFISAVLASAEVYYAKIDPYEIKKVASNVTGEVLEIHEELLGTVLKNQNYIVIDATLDRAELHDVKGKIASIKELIKLSEENLQNLSKVLQKKRHNYKKTEALTIKSRIDKDREFYDLVASENAYINAKKEILNLQNTLRDLEYQQIRLEKNITDKSLHQKEWLLYKLIAREGEVVSPGKPLAELADVSRGVLTFYVDADTLKNINQKSVYINGKKSTLRVDRFLPLSDSVNISKFKVQIIVPHPKEFSKLVEIQLKEE